MNSEEGTDRSGTVTERTPSRRAVLGGLAGVAAGATSGCIQRVRTIAGQQSAEQVSLTIKTFPADTDEMATRIARSLATNLETVGIDPDLTLLSVEEFHREVLINHDFDLYVARYPGRHDPDFLRPFLHSVFAGEPGWQNPFGFTDDLTLDDLLDRQRRLQGERRREAIFEAQRRIAQQQPFATVAVPDDVGAVRTDHFDGWTGYRPGDPLSNLALRRRDADEALDATVTDEGGGRLRVTTTTEEVTRNFNPLSVEFPSHDITLGMLYDPLARRYDGAMRPWLAADIAWDRTGDGTVATLELREDLTWHDGQSLTVEDVTFTYEFLADTSLGGGETPVPAPRFGNRVSTIESMQPIGDRTLRFGFGDVPPEVAVRAFTVPVLPEHEWRPKAEPINIAGVELFEGVTEALVWSNPEPVGSGPSRFERSITDDTVLLSRFDDHFLAREADPGLETDRFDGAPDFEEYVVRVVPSDRAAVELITADEADATGSTATPSVVPQIGRHDRLQLAIERSRSFYHVGFNTRRGPPGNTRFRRAVARLLDEAHLVAETFDGYARPAAVPLAGTEWVPSDLRWEGTNPEVPFAGTDGSLDETTARKAFREAGYRYDEDGRLLDQ